MRKYIYCLFVFLLTACTAPTVTPNPAEIALTMLSSKVQAEATQAAVNSIFTATAQVAASTTTAQAINTEAAVAMQKRIDAQATSDQQRFDAQATQQRADIDAQATQQRIDADAREAQDRRDMEATAVQNRLNVETTQQAEATVRADSMTQVVLPLHNSWTQQAVEQEILIATNEVELSNLRVQQQQQTNTIEWALPFLIAVILAIAVVVFILRYSRAREFKNDDGDIELIVFDGDKAMKPALMAKPMLLLGTNQMPDMVPPAEQSHVTERAQMIKALSVMPAQVTPNAAGAFNKYFSQDDQKKMPVIEVLQPDQVGQQILNEIEGQVVEEG